MITFREYVEPLIERIINIGINPEHEKYREQHRQEIHSMLRKAYEPIGGYSGHKSGSKEESDAIHADISKHMIKATKRDGKITTAAIYKGQHGRKSIASATDKTDQGKKDFIKTNKEDMTQKRSWGEVSGAVEHIRKKLGFPSVSSSTAERLIGKKVTHDEDGEHYVRKIGDTEHRKTVLGYPKEKD